LKKLSEVLW